MSNIKVFVADDVNEEKLVPLKDAGITIEKRTRLNAEALAEALKDCDGLIVRSETKVCKDLMNALRKLCVIGRAGVGVDNIDVKTATARHRRHRRFCEIEKRRANNKPRMRWTRQRSETFGGD